MKDQTEQSIASNRHFCAHCGTENDKGGYACNRCGERLIEVTKDSNPPSGLNSCEGCGGANNTRAAYCWVCGSEMKDSARIAPSPKPELQGPSATSPRTYRPDLNPVSTHSTKQSTDGPAQRADLGSTAPVQEHNRRTASISQESPIGHVDSATPNSSGTRDGEIPSEIKKWNWAAFLMPAVWGLFSGVPFTVLLFGAALLPPTVQLVIMVVVSIYLGAKGNEHAWRGKKWRSTEHFLTFQKQWTSWAVKLTIAVIALLLLYVLFAGGAST